MRRIVLDPPRVVLAEVWPRARAPVPRPAADVQDPPRDRMGAPSPASEHRRPLFHPRRGRLRRLERRFSHFLARDVFPHLPWMHVPYDHQLRRALTLSEANVAVAGLPRAFDGLRHRQRHSRGLSVWA